MTGSGFFQAIRWVVPVGLALVVTPAGAHPAHAEEVNYPLVSGFNRFYVEGDAPEHLARGGELLLNELNCTACHEPPAVLRDRFPGVPGPRLHGVASRFGDEAVLQILVRNPRFLKRSTIMPSLFAAGDRDDTELDAIHAYLISLREPPGEPLLLGDVDRGRELYHAIGCVACHAPDQEFFPPALPRETRLEAPAMPSQPVRISLFWTTDYLTRFLLDPVREHPGARMPGHGLSEIEAADLAAYLQASPFREEPDPRLLGEPADPALVDRGRTLFAAKGCVNCHDAGEAGAEPPPLRALPLLELRPLDEGCLSEEPVPGGVPYYYLSPLQRVALRLALQGLAAAEAVTGRDEWLARMDCYACHAWEGRGGPELAREPYFGAVSPYEVDREEFLPPELDGVFREGKAEEWIAALTGRTERRHPKVGARMIVLPEEVARQLLRAGADGSE